MAKKKHVIHRYKVRLRPKIAQQVQSEVDYLKGVVTRRDQQIDDLLKSLREKDKGRSLKSHLSGWWRHRNA